ncbi:potassium channel family protein [Evansella cellulosilytica]|uniref:TrkA-N domain protein n=1 Tax=Evansella cellulosilytica (strain ATCC 21833 / DSM 2522 / FERM P-1141 / JCM 9156 / N-4) TaxID=649639 RepID=E6TQV7_EVAC2|nr:TrkA family potassium uptake protein [Evansella cellulosilytica]ADU31732.1 TrkA-N domain protein [Evansella cellulosilytica DSM 2522]
MAKKKQFVVIGLGRFGGSICRELIKIGHEVLVIDKDEQKVSDFSNIVTHAVVANSTDENTLRSLGVRNFDFVIVAIGDNIQESILTTLLLKELGIKNVWVKAKNDYHHRVLEKIGADTIVHPEKDMGRRIAQQMSDDKIIDFIELSDEYSIVELLATPKLNKKSLVDLNIRARYGITILAVKKGNDINISPEPSYEISEGDLLIVIGNNRDIKRFEDEVM